MIEIYIQSNHIYHSYYYHYHLNVYNNMNLTVAQFEEYPLMDMSEKKMNEAIKQEKKLNYYK